MFYPFEVTTPHIIYALLGAFIVLFGMFSLFLRERLYVGEAIWAFVFGIIIGPYCADIFNPREWGGGSDQATDVITLEFTRVVLAIGVFAVGVELPKAYMAKHWRSLIFLLVPVMTWGWFVSAGLIFALVPGLNFLSSLAVAACLTPTDPILAAAVVGGKWADKHVPAHIRHLLAAESGCNDGAAFPFLFIALYLIVDAPNTGVAIRDWFLQLWLYQIVLGAVIGSMLGFSFRYLMKFCERRDLIDRQSYVAQYVSLAMLTIGVTTLLGSDDLLAAFFCGTAFAWDGFFNKQTAESVFSSVIDTLFNVAAFIFVGAWMPFNKFHDASLTLSVWRLIVIAILVLLLRRLPIIMMLYRWIPDIKTFREAMFSGHFGPIGIGAVFISTLAVEVLQTSNKKDHQTLLLIGSIQPIVAFMVLCSITIHGLSVPSFSLGRRVHSVSRTWSRRDTQTSAPDWTNQARLVTRAEDIIINRDVERGEGTSSMLEKKEDRSTPSTPTLEAEKLADSKISEETRVQHPEPSPPRTHPGLPYVAKHDYRDQNPPDGTDLLDEWLEGSHRVIEKKMGPGSDLEVSVINDNHDGEGTPPRTTWRGKMHELEHDAESIGHSISKELSHLTSVAKDAVSSELSLVSQQKQKELEEKAQPTALTGEAEGATAVADEDDEEGWASEGSNGPGPVASTSAGTMESKKMARTPSRTGKGIHTTHHATRGRRRTSVRRNSTGASDIVEEPRGREGRPSTADNHTVTFASDTPHYRSSRQGTASSSSHFGPSRPSTADSILRNSRIGSIRALHSGPPTRENSPSRSVRFLDEETRAASSRNVIGEMSGRTLVDSPVAEEHPLPPPTPPPAASGSSSSSKL